MAIPKKEDYLFYRGEKFQVEFYFTETGKIPVIEYLEETSLDVKVKLAALVKYIAEHGKIFDITKFRLVDSKEKIFEFKPVGHRFFNLGRINSSLLAAIPFEKFGFDTPQLAAG